MKRSPPLVVIAGFRGAGKTTWGEAAAKTLGVDFQDLDSLVEARLGTTILDFVETFGEGAFREAESTELKKFLAVPPQRDTIFGLGGGTLDSDDSLSLLKAQGACLRIWIDTSEELCRQRLMENPTRLRIKGLGDPGQWKCLWDYRRPRFRDFATHTIEVRDRSFDGTSFGAWLEAVWQSKP